MLIFLSSCGAIKPTAPLLLQDETNSKISAVNNQIVVPLEVNLSKLVKEAENKVPDVMKGGDYPCSGVRYMYEFYKDAFQITADKQTIITKLDGSYWIKMNYCATCTGIFGDQKCLSPVIPFSCGVNETKPSVKISLLTDVSVNKDFGLTAKTKIDKVEPVNPCKVTVFKFDATEKVMERVTAVVTEQAKTMDAELAEISFKKDAEDLWKQLNKSISVPGFGYLHVQPKSISLVKPRFENNKLYTALLLNCSTLLNQTQEQASPSKLPELQIVSSIPKDTFELITDITLDYDSLSTLMTKELGGKTLDLRGKQFVFTKFDVNALPDNRIVIGVTFDGSKKGVLYLKGTPEFNNESKVFSLTAIDYDIQTISTLIKMADWLFSKKITEELRKASTVDFKEDFDKLKATVNQSLKQKIGDYQLNGKVHDAKVETIKTNLTNLYLRTSVKANLKVTD
ncbi:MAG: DUF4403 family protein [Crocinitomicaceae bacterium]|nr:DUF4403 family protein [Crocinitomicaceae bacterium]